MDKKRILSLLKEGWGSLEQRFKKNPILSDPKFIVRSNQPYDRNSPIRRLGSEPYFQAALYSELSKMFSTNKDLVLGVEGKKIFEKRPDILAWDPCDKKKKPYFIIELKVTGLNFFTRPRKQEGHFLEDINLYLKSKLWEDEDNTLPLLFYGCYYESDPDEIKSRIRKYGSVSRWAIKGKQKSFPKSFIKSIVEGYAFTGETAWDFVNNDKL